MEFRHYFVQQVHATTFHQYKGEIESLAYAGDLLRRNPEARVASLPFAVPSAERKGWTFKPSWPVPINQFSTRGLFVVPFYRGRFCLAQVMDVGPWMTDDPYWRNGNRPRAEDLYREGGSVFSPQRQAWIKVSHPGSVDFTPQVWVELGINPVTAWGLNFSDVVDLAIIEYFERKDV